MEILKYLPKSWLSYALGKLAHISLPQILATPLIMWFVKRYNVDLSEIAEPIETFKSIGHFFTRELKKEARPIQTSPVSSADSYLRAAGTIPEDGSLTQIKSLTYSLDSLLGSNLESNTFKGGFFFNFYLSPKDYHRVHSPVTGTVMKVTHIPGALWPVNDWSLYSIKNLFCINERVITYIQTDLGLAAVVMVGATNVGRISLKFCNLVTNTAPWAKKKKMDLLFSPERDIRIEAGEQLGTFHLGSTVILLLQKSFESQSNFAGYNFTPRSIKFGQTLHSSNNQFD